MFNDRCLNAPVHAGGNPECHNSGWHAQLELNFSRTADRTVLTHRRQNGPLTVQRPFYPEDGVCHTYILHPPGGVVGGDRLELDIKLEDGAEALLTTPASGKFYRSMGQPAVQTVNLRAGENASLEWLPQETIVYDGAHVRSEVHIQTEVNTRFFGWEMICFGRPAAGESFLHGQADFGWRLDRAGKPWYIERMNMDHAAFAARWGLQGHPACGTLFASPVTKADRNTVSALLDEYDHFGVTLIDDLLICRGFDNRSSVIRSLFMQIWKTLRLSTLGLKVSAPRIWAT